MTFEDRLESIDTSLKTLVTILQSAGVITAAVDSASNTIAADIAEAPKKTRAKKTEDAPAAAKPDLVAGDAEGTRYWVSEETQTAYAQKPGDPDPADQSFKIESSAHYLAKKAEFAKNAAAAAEAQKPAATAPSATAQPDTASAGAPDWDTVFREIKALSTAPTGGREAVLGVLKHFGCEGKTVPALQALNKHAEILAHVKALLAPAADDLGL
jgi:hypothetical protein